MRLLGVAVETNIESDAHDDREGDNDEEHDEGEAALVADFPSDLSDTIPELPLVEPEVSVHMIASVCLFCAVD